MKTDRVEQWPVSQYETSDFNVEMGGEGVRLPGTGVSEPKAEGSAGIGRTRGGESKKGLFQREQGTFPKRTQKEEVAERNSRS